MGESDAGWVFRAFANSESLRALSIVRCVDSALLCLVLLNNLAR